MASLDFSPRTAWKPSKAVVQHFISRRTYDRHRPGVVRSRSLHQSPHDDDHAVLGACSNRQAKEAMARLLLLCYKNRHAALANGPPT